jgi:hypothetical protein
MTLNILRLVGRRPTTFAALLALALLAANVIALPKFVTGGQLRRHWERLRRSRSRGWRARRRSSAVAVASTCRSRR